MEEIDTQGKYGEQDKGQGLEQWRPFMPFLDAPFLQHLHACTKPEAL